MLAHTFLATQLRTARDAISRALTAIERDQVGPSDEELLAPPATPAAVLVEPPDPLARSMALAMTIQQQVEHGRAIGALTERLDKLTKILLDIAPDACARHDLFGC